MRNGPVDFAIVTTLKVEREALLRRLRIVEVVQEEGDPHTYYCAQLDLAGGGCYSAVLTMLLAPGNPSAAASTTRLIQRWQPKYVLVVGIAGGVSGRVALGDVVVAEFCYAYEQTKRTPSGDEPRGQQWPTDRFLFGRALAFDDSVWKQTVGVAAPGLSAGHVPTCHFGPLASGEKVISDLKTLPRLIRHVPKLLGTEMEGAGVAQGVNQYMPAPGFFDIRGISDFADDQKADDWHVYAANAAAAYTIALLQSGPVKPANEAVRPRPAANPTPLVGSAQHVGRYRLLRELGQGGMGTVYLAHDPDMDRQVAIKILSPQLSRDAQFRVRFQQEAKLIGALEHPCIVPVYDYGEAGDQPYLVMRYMMGGTLTRRLAQGPMPLAESVRIVQRLAEALDAAHQQAIIHRDVKPGNVLFGARGNAALSDFGLAKLLTNSPAASDSLGAIGTPVYMSPEQAQGGQPLDRRTDIYSLGVVLYEMLAGHPPFAAETPAALMLAHISAPIPRLDTVRLKLPDEVNGILACALAKGPDERYATAGEMAQALAAYGPMATLPPAAARATASAPRPQITTPSPERMAPSGQATRERVVESAEPSRKAQGSFGRLQHVAAGPFLMGSSLSRREAPIRTVLLAEFDMAQLPVTSSQYAAFIEASGYQEPRWWSEAGWAWRQGKRNAWGRGDRSQPDGWANQLLRPVHPVTGVTCYEVEAYCRWLSAHKHRLVRLPTEEEWEKAARGTDGRMWPWGEQFGASQANTHEYGVLDTLAAGHLAGDVSPYGLQDMGGNVQEWTASLYQPMPDEVFPEVEVRVARGGSWNDTAFGARAAFRHAYPPGYYFPFLGFRIVVGRR